MFKPNPPSRKTYDSLTCSGGGGVEEGLVLWRGRGEEGLVLWRGKVGGGRLLLTGIKPNITVSADVVHFLHGWGGGLGLLTVGVIHHVLVGHLPRVLGH